MEINEKIFYNVLKANLSLDHYYLLNNIKQDILIIQNKRIEGYIGFLKKKGWVNNNNLTTEGVKLLAQIEENEVILQVMETKEKSFTSFCKELHTKIENKIIELNNGKRTFKNPSGKFLLCSEKELQTRLEGFVKKYNYKNTAKIEEELLKHTEYCLTINQNRIKDKYARIIYYFIMRDGFPSDLLAACNREDEEITITSTIEQQGHIDTKDLF